MYADLDFVLAICKTDDWLKEKAARIYNEHKNEIWTSNLTVQEALLYAKKHALEPSIIVQAIYYAFEVRPIRFSRENYLEIAEIMREHGATPFDAMHAIAAKEDGTIISSDDMYDRIGLKRIKLEE